MSARHNKKQRKGRNNANNRERTVTTLTEDPNTPYLVPTPSEDPPSGHISAHLVHPTSMGSQPFPMSSNFGGFQAYPGKFNPQQQPYFPTSQQSNQQSQPTPSAPPGAKNDLEILQNLKQLILENQHPIFRAVPQPAVLSKLYRGTLPAAMSQPQAGNDSGEPSMLGFVPPAPDSGRLGKRKDSSSVPQQKDPYHKSAGDNTISDANPSNGIKKQSLDDPMDGGESHRANLSRSDSWTAKQPPVYSESGRPDSDRTPTRGGPGPLSLASAQANTRSSTSVFDPPGDVRDRDRGAAADAHGWSWQDRNHRRPEYDRPTHHGRQQSYHRARGVSSALDHHRPMADDPPIRRGGPVVESSQPVDSRGPSTDVVRPSAVLDRPPHESRESIADPKRSVDYDARVPPLSSRIEGMESNAARPIDSVSSRAALPGLSLPDAPVQDPGHPSSRQPAHDTAAGGGGGDSHVPPSRANARPAPYGFNKKKFQRHPPNSAGPNQAAPYNTPASDHPNPRLGQGRPPSPSLPPPATNRPIHPRSSSVDGRRGGRFPSPAGGARAWDTRAPPSGRDIPRDRPPPSYRGDYEPDVSSMRYGDGRTYGRGYSPPPPTHGPSFPPGERGPPATYAAPSSGIAQGRDWGTYGSSYPPENRRDWSAAEEEGYLKQRTWEGRPPPPPSSERDRFEYPPRSANWAEREYPGRDSYPPGPLPPPPSGDDRYGDRGRPPNSAYQPYTRVTRPRSPSPLRRAGPDSLDDRPPVKRAREEYDPVDYYSTPPPATRRGPHPPGEYAHPPPPRAASPGPSGAGPSWPPPPASSGSNGGPSGAGLPPDRDYRYPPPVSGSYERPRSPGPPRGRPYSRGGGYGRDGGGRNTYPPRD